MVPVRARKTGAVAQRWTVGGREDPLLRQANKPHKHAFPHARKVVTPTSIGAHQSRHYHPTNRTAQGAGACVVATVLGYSVAWAQETLEVSRGTFLFK